MRLRNKKTGEIEDVTFDIYNVDGKGNRICISTEINIDGDILGKCIASYASLAELNEEWEDYEPKEPLIKDTECRKIMRLWADRCGVKTVTLFGSEFVYGGKSIGISFGVDFGLEHRKLYTIDELCGEEEE